MAGKKTSKKIDDWKDFIKYWKDWEFTRKWGGYYNLSWNEFDSLLEKSFSKWAWKEYKDTIPTPRDLIDKIIQILEKEVWDLNSLQPALDPFAWTGGILLRLAKNWITNIVWLEKFKEIAQLANENLIKNWVWKVVINDKFLTWVKNKKKKYNLIFTNPPSDFFDTNTDLSIFDKILAENWYLIIFSSSLEKLDSVKDKFFKKYNLKYLIRLPKWVIWNLQQNVLIFQKQSYEEKTILLDLLNEDKNWYSKYIDNLIKFLDKVKTDIINQDIKKPINLDYLPNTTFINYNKNRLNYFNEFTWELTNYIKESFKISKEVFFAFKSINKILSENGVKINLFDEEKELENKILVKELYDKIIGKYIISDLKFLEFVISLQLNNFLILSWPSWVGKTKIVDTVTDIINEISWNMLTVENISVPVKSNWFDESETLWYWNSLLGNYETWKILKFLVQASANTERPYFMLFDEMNLSNIEFYFTSFIADIDKLKTEWKIEVPLFEEVIFKEDKSKIKKLKQFLKLVFAWIYSWYENFVNIESLDKSQQIDGKNLKDMLFFSDMDFNFDIKVKFTLPIFSNLHIIGTINEDETTYPLSNRVLDRASYILFDVDLNEEKKELKIKDNYELNLSSNKYEKNYKKIENLANIDEDLKNKVQSVNEKLEGDLSNLKIAYRSLEYMQNFKNIVKEIAEIKDEDIYKMLFEQKIKPRLKSSLTLDNEGLIEILKSEFEKENWEFSN